MPPSRYARKSKCKETRKFYIAPEGTVTEIHYFENFKKAYRIENLHLISRKSTSSSPEFVVDYALDFCKKQKIKPSEFVHIAIVIDFDRWKSQIPKAYKKAKQRNFHMYISNPCIELWFILHHHTLSDNEMKELTSCKSCKQLFEKFYKGNYKRLLPFTEKAILNAEQMDVIEKSDWPQKTGTKLYQLVRLILSANLKRS